MTAMTGALVAGNLGLLVYLRLRGWGVRSSSRRRPARLPGWAILVSQPGHRFNSSARPSCSRWLYCCRRRRSPVEYRLQDRRLVSATFVNASMPFAGHQKTDSRTPPDGSAHCRRRCRGRRNRHRVRCPDCAPELLGPAVIIAIWLITSSASAVATRMTYRFLAPNATARTMTVSSWWSHSRCCPPRRGLRPGGAALRLCGDRRRLGDLLSGRCGPGDEPGCWPRAGRTGRGWVGTTLRQPAHPRADSARLGSAALPR